MLCHCTVCAEEAKARGSDLEQPKLNLKLYHKQTNNKDKEKKNKIAIHSCLRNIYI